MRISSLTRGPSREGGVGGAGGLAMEVSYKSFENDGLEPFGVAMQSGSAAWLKIQPDQP